MREFILFPLLSVPSKIKDDLFDDDDDLFNEPPPMNDVTDDVTKKKKDLFFDDDDDDLFGDLKTNTKKTKLPEVGTESVSEKHQ